MPQRGHPAPEGPWSLPGLLMAREPEPEADGLLDLSFLTEEEQEAIAEVLKRDARLRQLEEGRISKLRASLADPGQLKILTGDWFQEARSQRHHHAHFGSDLVRASIRRKKGCRRDQAGGSDVEAEAAGEETPWSPVGPSLTTPLPPPRLSVDEGPQERFIEAEVSNEDCKLIGRPWARPLSSSVTWGCGPSLQGMGWGTELGKVQDSDATSGDPGSQAEQALKCEGANPCITPPSTSLPPIPHHSRDLNPRRSLRFPSPDLSGSQMSLSGEPEAGAVQVRGSVHFALRYEPGAAELRVHVIQCQGLAAARRRRSDPYVKSYLLPDKQSKRKTTVKKRNLNPVFNEILRYSVPQTELRGRVLSLSVWHRESLGRNIFLGEVEVPLDTWDWDSEPTWLPLQPRVPPSPDDLPSRGLLSLSLKYLPAGSEGPGLPPSGELHFWVKEVQDLIPLRSGSPDTFVQCSVLPDDSRASRQRTRVVRRSLNPMFNHTMVYDGFGPADLRQACAELSLWDHGVLGSRQLGGTRLSLGTGSSYGLQVPWMDSTREERQLWQTLLERPCEWVDGLLPLRTNLAPRT
ncbi:Synaptotagmin-like protein 1 [Bos mutus]|uniref:Synaptotagmin-like protein 1 n=1 Tax=Bos mutus TaxID=72004 RepID=L8IJK3_9CETA|nr:Synaptotagmin-like protein 1 [Bos mutus]